MLYYSTVAPKYFRTRGHVLICQNSNCQARGSAHLFKALWNHLEQEKLAYYKTDGHVRLTESGCLGACSYGPTVCVYREQQSQAGQGQLQEAWYAGVDLPLAKQIVNAIQHQSDLPTQHRYDPQED